MARSIKIGAYLLRYGNAIIKGRGMIRISPVFISAVLYVLPVKEWLSDPTIKDTFIVSHWSMITGGFTVIWAVFVGAIWLPIEIINEEMDKRDSDEMLRSRQARIERTYYLIHLKITDAEKKMTGGNVDPELFSEWDVGVRNLIGQRCQSYCVNQYERLTRPNGQEKIAWPDKAVVHLKYMLGFLEQYVH